MTTKDQPNQASEYETAERILTAVHYQLTSLQLTLSTLPPEYRGKFIETYNLTKGAHEALTLARSDLDEEERKKALGD